MIRFDDLDPRSQLCCQVIMLAADDRRAQGLALLEANDEDTSLAFECAMTAASYLTSLAGDPGTITATVDEAQTDDIPRSERLAAFVAAVGNADADGAQAVFYSAMADVDARTAARHAGQLLNDCIDLAADVIRRAAGLDS